MQTIISNTENEPFLLPLDISQYGNFEHDELELRVTNDFIEISGNQEWRMVNGGAAKRSFVQRHVLPNYIDLNAIYCNLLNSNTILITAPSISFVSKLTNKNRPKVDYVLTFDNEGRQYLKRYNLTNTNSNYNQICKLFNKQSKWRPNPNMSKDQITNVLMDLIKKGKTNSSSKIFSNNMGHKNINFVSSLNKTTKKSNGIRLNIDQLMNVKDDKTKEKSSYHKLINSQTYKEIQKPIKKLNLKTYLTNLITNNLSLNAPNQPSSIVTSILNKEDNKAKKKVVIKV